MQEQQFAKSRLDAEYYQYKKAEHEGDLSNAARYKARVDQLEQQIATLEVPIAELKARVDALQAEIKAAEAPLDEIAEERRIRLSDYQRMRERMDTIMPAILPGIRVAKAPEIQQVVITGLNTTNFNEPLMRVERCQTCHMGIDRAGFEGRCAALCDTSTSRCPVGASPRRKIRLHQSAMRDRAWPSLCLQRTANCIFSTRPHAWPSPCSPIPGFNPNVGNVISRSYRPCSSPRPWPMGRNSFKRMGCPGCHLAQGYEQQAKVAPDLRRVASKVDPSWLVEWIKAPNEYWPATKMPNFLLSWEESEAAAAYLLSSSTPYTGPRYPGNGDAEAGKKIVEDDRLSGMPSDQRHR